MAHYLFMSNINQLLNHFHRREKRIKLQIEQLNVLQHMARVDILIIGRNIAESKTPDSTKEYISGLAYAQSRRAANSYLLDELYHELAGVRGNIRQLSEAKRRGNK